MSCLAACLLVSGALATAQAPAGDAYAPVPPAIRAAKKLFLSNAGSDSGLFPEPFSGGPSRPYMELYNGLKATGHYELVNDPAQADLVLELRLMAPAGPQNPDKQKGSSDPLPMLRLVVYDRATHYVLWAMTESVEGAYLQKTHDRNLDLAIAALVGDYESVSGTLPANAPASATGNPAPSAP
jgi:hypothetical protein